MTIYVSCLEITLKHSIGKLRLPEEPRVWFENQLSIWEFPSLELKRNHMYRSGELELLHRDPFDRLLVAQGLSESLALITPEPAVWQYPVEVVW